MFSQCFGRDASLAYEQNALHVGRDALLTLIAEEHLEAVPLRHCLLGYFLIFSFWFFFGLRNHFLRFSLICPPLSPTLFLSTPKVNSLSLLV